MKSNIATSDCPPVLPDERVRHLIANQKSIQGIARNRAIRLTREGHNTHPVVTAVIALAHAGAIMSACDTSDPRAKRLPAFLRSEVEDIAAHAAQLFVEALHRLDLEINPPKLSVVVPG